MSSIAYGSRWEHYKPYLLPMSFFILVAVAIAFLVPVRRGSQYEYTRDKPWQGSMLTAPYNFPIYKTPEQVQKEQDSLRASQRPVYSTPRAIRLQMLEEFSREYDDKLKASISSKYFVYASEYIDRAYQKGIISVDALRALQQEKRSEIFVVSEGNVSKAVQPSSLPTPKEVYSKLIEEAQAKRLSADTLARMDVLRFIKDNVHYDSKLTALYLEEAMSHLSLSSGMVLEGQKIIDRGELVTAEIYQVLRSLEREQEKRSMSGISISYIRIGVLILSLLVLSLLGFYLFFLIRNYEMTLRNNLLILVMVLVFVLLTSVATYYGLFSVYMVPYAMIVILLRVFLDSYTALISFTATILLSALFVVEPLGFILVQMLAGLTALVSLKKLTSRGQMIRTSFLVYLSYSVAYLGMYLVRNGELSSDHWKIQIVLGVNLILLNFSYILSAIIERVLGYVSNVSLVELSDINTPILKELSEVAPGTFQHSIQVSILAVEAAERIGANTQLIRAGALYHDIGKTLNPAYFTENQSGVSPHDKLPYNESAGIIIQHVTDGIALAQKHHLPYQIIDFIRTHHSDGLVKYFYLNYCREHEVEEVDQALFRYPGPKPFTREQGILMLADATEASSRSLKEYSEEIIRAHVDRIIDGIVSEGHMNETPLTFRDIQTIKGAFVQKLRTMYHTRIAYPQGA